MSILSTPADPAFETRLNRLRGADYAGTYKQSLERFLEWIDRYFGELPSPDTSGGLFSQIRLSLSVSSFELLLRLAFSYPIVFVILAWLFTNSGSLGEVTVLGEIDAWRRVLVVLFILAACYSFIIFYRTDGWRSWLWMVVAFAVAVAVAFAFAGAGAGAFAGAVAGAVAVAVAGAVAVAVVFAGAFAVAVAGAFAVAVAFAFALGMVYLETYVRRSGRMMIYFCAFYLFSICYLAISTFLIFVFSSEESILSGLTILLFLGVFPLLNAPLDWLSFGITRGLLRSIAGGGHGTVLTFLWAVADVLLALFFLLLVALVTWSGIYLMNQVAHWASGAVVVDLHQLLHQLRCDGWRANLWIWLMLGSTLLPTAIHFLIASLAGFLALGKATAKTAADKMQIALDEVNKHPDNPEARAAVIVDSDARMQAFLYLYVAPALVVVIWLLLVGLVSFGVFKYLPDLVQGFLEIFGRASVPVGQLCS